MIVFILKQILVWFVWKVLDVFAQKLKFFIITQHHISK